MNGQIYTIYRVAVLLNKGGGDKQGMVVKVNQPVEKEIPKGTALSFCCSNVKPAAKTAEKKQQILERKRVNVIIYYYL